MKSCRHCKLEIHDEARLCPHCHGFQSWVANQRDSRMVSVLIGLVAMVLLLVYLITTRLPGSRTAEQPPQLAVKDHAFRTMSAVEGTRLFVMGHVADPSTTAGSQVWFTVRVLGASGNLLDEYQAQSPGLLVPASGTVPFRLSTVVAAAPAEIQRVEVAVARASAPSRWD